MIKNCIISFSGGGSSAYMLWWLINNKSNEYNFKVVFANTGQENEETLDFVQQCSEKFGVEIVWLEAVPRVKVDGEVKEIYEHLHEIKDIKWSGARLGTRHRIVDYKSADRVGKVYEAVIARYGLPSIKSPHCTRELKLAPINSYIKNELGWKKCEYVTAIGIRSDEIDRISPNYKQKGYYYPLISDRPMTKQKINFWWSMQDFKLDLKGYQGNCKWCFKKSLNKLKTIAKETPSAFDFPREMEKKYGSYVTPDRLKVLESKGKEIPKEINIFRGNRKVEDIIKESENFNKEMLDENEYLSDSCEIDSECGDY